MNDIASIDIFDKSALALATLFKDGITLNDKLIPLNKDIGVDGILKINSTELSFIVLAHPTIGKISKAYKDYFSNSNKKRQPIFIIDYATKELVQFFRKENLFFVDTVGNCFIDLPNLKVFVAGRKVIVKEPIVKRAFQKTGLKLIYNLLINPNLASETYRQIATQTKISLASIGYIFEELKEDKFLVEINKEKKQLSNIKRLITKWAISYGENLRPKIHRGYFTPFDEKIFKTEIELSSNAEELAISGAYGAYLLNGAIKPEKIIIYTNERISKLAKKYKIVPLGQQRESATSIEILERFWEDGSNLVKLNFNEVPNEKSTLVSPILIYADLMQSNNYRSIETAENILNNEIRHRFLQNNFQW